MKKLFVAAVAIGTGVALTLLRRSQEKKEPTGCCSLEHPEACAYSYEPQQPHGVGIQTISLSESLDHLNDEKAVLFFGFDDCPGCIEAYPVFEKIASTYPMTPVYHVDVKRSERESGQVVYDQIYAFFKEALDKEGCDKMYVPYVAFLKSGEIIATHTGTLQNQESLDEEGKAQLAEIYRRGFNQLI